MCSRARLMLTRLMFGLIKIAISCGASNRVVSRSHFCCCRYLKSIETQQFVKRRQTKLPALEPN